MEVGKKYSVQLGDLLKNIYVYWSEVNKSKYFQNRTLLFLLRNVPHGLCDNNQDMSSIYPMLFVFKVDYVNYRDVTCSLQYCNQ